MSVESLDNEIATIDEYGFQYRSDYPWLPESLINESQRLHYNLCIYKIGVGFGKKYPPQINKDMADTFDRVRRIKSDNPGLIPDSKIFDDTLRGVLRSALLPI